MKNVSIINIGALLTVVILFLLSPLAHAQQKVDKKFDTIRCGSHTGNTSGYSWTQCDQPAPNVVTVTKTEVREVKVPVPVVVPAPAPAKAPEKPIRE